MNQKEARAAWVTALRSGKYTQGRQALCTIEDAGEKHCCLGVACELYQKDVGDLTIYVDWSTKIYDQNTQTLPQKVTDWLGLMNSRSIYGQSQLTAINDAGFSFEHIAEIIESEPEGLFV